MLVLRIILMNGSRLSPAGRADKDRLLIWGAEQRQKPVLRVDEAAPGILHTALFCQIFEDFTPIS